MHFIIVLEMIKIFLLKVIVFSILFFIYSEIFPFLGKFLISAIIIYALIYIEFLKRRLHLISITVSNVYRLRSYQRLRHKISKIIGREFEKSHTFIFYLKYRKFVFSIYEHQRDQADQDVIVNPIKPITKVFALKIIQDVFQSICIQFWRLKYGEMYIEEIKTRLNVEENNIPTWYFSVYRYDDSPVSNWFYPFS